MTPFFIGLIHRLQSLFLRVEERIFSPIHRVHSLLQHMLIPLFLKRRLSQFINLDTCCVYTILSGNLKTLILIVADELDNSDTTNGLGLDVLSLYLGYYLKLLIPIDNLRK